MLSTSDFKRGLRIEVDGDPYTMVDVTKQSPTARGGNTLVRTKLRNIRSGQLIDKVFKSGDRVKAPDFEIKDSQYLYDEGGEMHYFMDNVSYEQFALNVDQISEELGYLRANDEVRALMFNGECIGIELPHTVTLEVKDTDPGVKGDTVTNVLKPAIMETGLEVQVPLFVEPGDQIIVDTRDKRYVKRG